MAEGGTGQGGGIVLKDQFPAAAYVQPDIAKTPAQPGIKHQETFTPPLYAVK